MASSFGVRVVEVVARLQKAAGATAGDERGGEQGEKVVQRRHSTSSASARLVERSKDSNEHR